MGWQRGAVLLVAVVGGLLVAGPAEAQTVKSGSLSFSGDNGDYITQGDSWAYSTGNGDGLTVSSSNGSTVAVSVNAYNGDWWTLTFDAPGTQQLTARTYSAAHRYPFNGTGPGLDLSGEGRGCNELTGSFTVTKAIFGADGYVQAFDATFEQHCEGGTPAAKGRVHIANATAPRTSTAKPQTTTTKPSTSTAKPRTSATKAPAKPRGTPTAKPTPAPTVGPSDAGVAGGQTTAGETRLVAALMNDGTFVRRALLGFGVIALLGLAVAGLLVAGIVRHVRGG
ncbi:hypothetical protein [Asanoa iriomotensis]|uniref:Uncharacterized protein n=1 Tax=Asanoa iriomotensis TaxID=234613 RepID=A0ABQ4C7Z1_9ACTN|nr:hypothetical protein [Asanoa iriomotensis]GIF58892.1 hypothetical protein Air01nite_49870 [Asanoa iriomotensis]